MPSASPRHELILTAAVAAILSTGCTKADQSPPKPRTDTIAARPVPASDTLLISASAIGPITLGMRLDSIKAAHPDLTFTRTSDGEGVALVEIKRGESAAIAYTGEEDPSRPIDFSKTVQSLETMSPAFHTAEGVHAGATVLEAENIYGKAQRIDKSEIEQREYITFENQPAYLTIRIDNTGLFEPDSMVTTRFAPEARILSISISVRPTDRM